MFGKGVYFADVSMCNAPVGFELTSLLTDDVQSVYASVDTDLRRTDLSFIKSANYCHA